MAVKNKLIKRLILLILMLVYEISTGRILPYTDKPVSINLYNAGQYADYIFKFILDNDLSSDGHIIIQFPAQYDNYLGVREFFKQSNFIKKRFRNFFFQMFRDLYIIKRKSDKNIF